MMVWLGAPIFFLLALLAEPLAPIGLGKEWSGVGVLCSIFAVSGFALFLSAILDRSFDVVRKQVRALWIEGSNSLVSLAVVWLMLANGADVTQALLGFAISNAVHYLVWIAVAWLSLGFSRAGLNRLICHVGAGGLLAFGAWAAMRGVQWLQ
jgi:O-antigen/teichoic acid export membrane protein